MTPATTPTTGHYTGTLEIKGLDDDRDEYTGVLLVTDRDGTPALSIHVDAGDRTFGAELHPHDDGGWRGHEKRRVPHRFELSLEGAYAQDGGGEFWVWGTLRTPDVDEDGVHVSGRFPVTSAARTSEEG